MPPKSPKSRRDHMGLSNRNDVKSKPGLYTEKPTSLPMNITSDRIYNTPCVYGKLNVDTASSTINPSKPAISGMDRLFPVAGPEQYEPLRKNQLKQSLPQSFQDVLGFQQTGQDAIPGKVSAYYSGNVDGSAQPSREMEEIFHPNPSTALASQGCFISSSKQPFKDELQERDRLRYKNKLELRKNTIKTR